MEPADSLLVSDHAHKFRAAIGQARPQHDREEFVNRLLPSAYLRNIVLIWRIDVWVLVFGHRFR
jgi:hypothetical protein